MSVEIEQVHPLFAAIVTGGVAGIKTMERIA